MNTPIIHCLIITYKTISPENKEILFSLLSSDEKLTFISLQSNSKKAEFLISRCAFKALGKLTGFELISYNATTKTIVCNNQTLYVSLSHTHNAVAVSLFHKPHGIDIEPCRRRVAYSTNIVKRYFALSEQEYINHLPWGKIKRFLKLWTIKEAIAKSQELLLTQALKYNTIANPDTMILISLPVGKEHICGIALGDRYHEKVLIRHYTMSSNDLIGFLCGCGQYRIRTSDLLV